MAAVPPLLRLLRKDREDAAPHIPFLNDEELKKTADSVITVIKTILETLNESGNGAVVSDFCMKHKLSDMLEESV